MEKQYYISKEQFLALKEAWKQKSHHSAKEMIIYNILRSKPADNGFVPKTKNIQGNDEWYAFNQARFSATTMCIAARTYVKAPGAKFGAWVDDMDLTLKLFKQNFGIDLPEDLAAKIRESRK